MHGVCSSRFRRAILFIIVLPNSLSHGLVLKSLRYFVSFSDLLSFSGFSVWKSFGRPSDFITILSSSFRRLSLSK